MTVWPFHRSCHSPCLFGWLRTFNMSPVMVGTKNLGLYCVSRCLVSPFNWYHSNHLPQLQESFLGLCSLLTYFVQDRKHVERWGKQTDDLQLIDHSSHASHFNNYLYNKCVRLWVYVCVIWWTTQSRKPLWVFNWVERRYIEYQSIYEILKKRNSPTIHLLQRVIAPLELQIFFFVLFLFTSG